MTDLVVAPPAPAADPAPVRAPDALAPVVARLLVRFGDEADAAEVRAVVEACHTRLAAGASVTTYLPVLAERAAAATLARRAGGVR